MEENKPTGRGGRFHLCLVPLSEPFPEPVRVCWCGNSIVPGGGHKPHPQPSSGYLVFFKIGVLQQPKNQVDPEGY